jgi:hypothetical protein
VDSRGIDPDRPSLGTNVLSDCPVSDIGFEEEWIDHNLLNAVHTGVRLSSPLVTEASSRTPLESVS